MKNTPLKTSMPLMTVDEMCTVIDNAKNEIIKLREALSFIPDLSAECLSNGDVRVGQGAEVAMRHINRKANEVLK
jgi:hypothetical protein